MRQRERFKVRERRQLTLRFYDLPPFTHASFCARFTLASAVATDGVSTGDTVEGYGTWDVGASDPFSHWFRETETAPDGVAANVSVCPLTCCSSRTFATSLPRRRVCSLGFCVILAYPPGKNGMQKHSRSAGCTLDIGTLSSLCSDAFSQRSTNM